MLELSAILDFFQPDGQPLQIARAHGLGEIGILQVQRFDGTVDGCHAPLDRFAHGDRRMIANEFSHLRVTEHDEFTQHQLLGKVKLEAIGDFFFQQPVHAQLPLEPEGKLELPARLLAAKRRTQVTHDPGLADAVHDAAGIGAQTLCHLSSDQPALQVLETKLGLPVRHHDQARPHKVIAAE